MVRLMNLAEIRKQAQKLLKDNRVQKPPVNPENIARRLGITIKYEPFEEDVSGVLYRDQRGTIIGVNSFHHPNRQRFTIAHEIGHFVLHEMEVHVDKGYRMIFRNTKSSRADDPLEIAANWFAAELLMPPHMLRSEVENFIHDFEDEAGLRTLARRYHVSTQAMAFRLANLGLFPE